MSNRIFIHQLCLFIVILMGLVGCSSGPRLIASYPQEEPRIWPTPMPSGDQFVARYHVILDLEVGDVHSASRAVTSLTHEYGGFVRESFNWRTDRGMSKSLVLAVPSARFFELRGKIRALGVIVHESWNSDRYSPFEKEIGVQYSYIAVNFIPRSARTLELSPILWDPATTFRKALGVFIRSFGFLVDLLIWILVVAAPFFFMGVGFIVLLRRIRRRL